jgi:hypothetical protein
MIGKGLGLVLGWVPDSEQQNKIVRATPGMQVYR